MKFSLLVLASMFIGCVISKPAVHSITDEVYLDHHHSWSNSPVSCFGQGINQSCSPVRSITLRIINRRYRDVKAEVSCHFKYENVFFGKNEVTVKKRNDKVFMVYGFAREFSDAIICDVTKIH